MMADAVVMITDRARAVVALADALDEVERDIIQERERHCRAMQALSARQDALQQAIFRFHMGVSDYEHGK